MSSYESIYTGSQIDTAVGRASVGGAIDTSHRLKSYTAFEQLGLTADCSMVELVAALPAPCCFTVAVQSGDIVNSLPVSYVTLEVVKYSIWYCVATATKRPSDNLNGRTQMWKCNITNGVQSVWTEFATDTDLSTKADEDTHNLKTYTGFSQLGLSGELSVADVVGAMPSGSTLTVYQSGSGTYVADLPYTYAYLVVRKLTSISAELWCSQLSSSDTSIANYYNGTLSSWQQLATDTDLSNKADIATRNLKTYTNLAQLGLSIYSATLQDINNALPYGASITYSVEGSEYYPSDVYPDSFGVFMATKTGLNRCFISFQRCLDVDSRTYFGIIREDGTHQWNLNATATTPTEYDLPLNGGYTSVDGYTCAYSKTQEGIVTLNFIIQGPINGTYNRMANLPVGFRPSKTITMLVTSTSAINVDLGRVVINANGDVSVQFKGSSTSGNFGGSGTFIASN